MPIIYTYPTETPTKDDYILISDVSSKNPANATRKCTLDAVVTLVGALVPGGGTVQSVGLSPGTTGLTISDTGENPIVTSGTFTVGGTLVAANGGTGHNNYNVGEILYADGATSLAKLTAGTLNYVLTANGAGIAPSWKVNPAAPVTSVSAIAPGASTGTPVIVTPTTGLVTVQSMAFQGDINVGHVPDASAAAGTSYSKNDGSWATPPDTDTTYTMSAATDGANVDLTLDASVGTDTTIQLTAGTGIAITQAAGNNITFTNSSTGGGGFDIINFAQGENLSGVGTILYFYQVVVPEDFTANKAKIYGVVSGSATYAVSIYDGLLSNLAGTTKLGDGTITVGATGILEVTLTEVSAGDLNLTKGKNIIMGFSQSSDDKLLCINNRISDSNLAISSTTALPFPSTLSGLEEQAASVLRPCCVLYQ